MVLIGGGTGEMGGRGDGEAAWLGDVGVCWRVEVDPLAGEELWLGKGW